MEPSMIRNRMSDDECLELLDRNGVAVLSMCGPDGSPYAVPVNYVRIGDSIYYHGRMTGTRVACMEHDPRCCLTVYEEVGFDDYGPGMCATSTAFGSVVVKGRASAVDEEDLKVEVLRRLTAKLVPSKGDAPIDSAIVARTGVFRISMEEVTGKRRAPKPGSTMHPAM